MSVQRGDLITLAAMSSLATLANQKAISGKPYKFLPEFWEVASGEEMLKLRWADRSDMPGGIAIRSDLMAAYQFTGSDYTDVNSWTAYPAIKVVATFAALGSGAEGDYGYIIGVRNGIYRRTSNAWLLQAGQWRGELDRLRSNATNSGVVQGLFNVAFPPFSFVDGEWWSSLMLMPRAGLSANRYTVANSTLQLCRWADSNLVKYEDPIFYWAGGNDANITFQGGAILKEYFTSYLLGPQRQRQQWRIRFDCPFDLQLATIEVLSATFAPVSGTARPYPAASVRVTQSSPNVSLRVSRGTGRLGADQVFLTFSGTVSADSEINFAMECDLPYEWFRSGTPGDGVTLSFSAALPGLRQVAAGIHSTQQVNSKTVIVDSGTLRGIRVASYTGKNTIYVVRDKVPDSDFWLFQNDQALVADVPGYWLAKIPFIQGIDVAQRFTGNGPYHNKLILAPQAEDPVSNGTIGTTKAVPAAMPRAFFRRDTDVPNHVPLEMAGSGVQIPAGSTVREVLIRRHGVGTPAVQPRSQRAPLQVQIGCIRNGAFASFRTVTIADDELFLPTVDWPIFTPDSLCYVADEAVDIQAQVCAPNPTNAFFNSNGQIAYQPMTGIMIADFYNGTEGLLGVIPGGV